MPIPPVRKLVLNEFDYLAGYREAPALAEKLRAEIRVC